MSLPLQIDSAASVRVPTHGRGSVVVPILAASLLAWGGSQAAGQDRSGEGTGSPGAAGSGSCPPSEEPSLAALAGTVRDGASQVSLPGARILVEIRGGDADGPGADGRLEEEVAADGSYLLCGLPPYTELEARAVFAGWESAPKTVTLAPGGRARRDFELAVGETGPGRLVGRVTDRETGRPLDAVEIVLVGSGSDGGPGRLVTDGRGRFAAEELAPGQYRVELRRLGYGSLREWVTLPPRRTLQVDVELAAVPITVEPLVVTTVRSRRLEEKGFYGRRAWAKGQGVGHFRTRADIERRGPQRISQMIAEVPGMGIDCRGTPLRCELRLTRSPLCRRANVYLNGVRVVRAENPMEEVTVDELVLPHDVEGLEIYPGAASLPAEFSGDTGRCGAVAIWTRSGP